MTSPSTPYITDEALAAFWAVVADRHPQATSGDLSPWTTITLKTIAEAAVTEWIANNVPQGAAS
jgi:hypothetical protein